jgi:hypothetical protein
MWLASGEPGSGARQHKEALEKKFGDTTAHGALGEQCHKLHHVHRCHGKFPLIPGCSVGPAMRLVRCTPLIGTLLQLLLYMGALLVFS